MTYTAQQIEKAKAAYTRWFTYQSAADHQPQFIGRVEAEQRAESHNKIVAAILAGDKALEAEWKYFFLNEEVKKDQKAAASANKLAANKAASADVLAQVKQAGKKLADYYSFVKSNKSYAKEFYSKKFTQASVDAFINL